MKTKLHLPDWDVVTLRDGLESSMPVRGSTHDFYKYPARFSPDFVGSILRVFSSPGNLVLDPFMGGGTTAVEAIRFGCNFIGTDVNTLSAFVAKSKTTPLTSSEIRAVKRWAAKFWSARLADPSNLENWQEYLRYIPWWIQKTIGAGLESADLLATESSRRFVRCTLLRAAQRMLDCRDELPTSADLRSAHKLIFDEMLSGIQRLSGDFKRVRSSFSISPELRILGVNAADLHNHVRLRRNQKVDLVITSPPYFGVNIHYHRWQIQSRRTTPAPYWIADCVDGNMGSYYTFGDCKRHDETYLEELGRCWKGIVPLLNRSSLIVQLVSFRDAESQLPAYLDVMKDLGLAEASLRRFSSPSNRFWRSVPNRKWYAKGNSAVRVRKEVVLFHRLRG